MRLRLALLPILLCACPTAGTSLGASGNTDAESASVYVSSKTATKIVFEIDHVKGRSSNAKALSRFQQRLEDLEMQKAISKPDGFTIKEDTELPASSEANHAYTQAELDALVTANKQTKSEGSTAAAYFLYVDGHFVEDTADAQVLGFAYGGDRIVMFADTIKSACTSRFPLLQDKLCEIAEASVLIHEFGHLLGLVNNGTAMVTAHQDTAHGAHDTSDQCIMYWTVNRASNIDALADALGRGNGAVKPFDANCIADLTAQAR